jgi:hypothetical protein
VLAGILLPQLELSPCLSVVFVRVAQTGSYLGQRLGCRKARDLISLRENAGFGPFHVQFVHLQHLTASGGDYYILFC